MRIFEDDGFVTEEGAKLWNEVEEKLRTLLLEFAERGVSLRDSTLLLHEVIPAAAQHALNRITTLREEPPA